MEWLGSAHPSNTGLEGSPSSLILTPFNLNIFIAHMPCKRRNKEKEERQIGFRSVDSHELIYYTPSSPPRRN
jgi:hypothetical protein